MIRAHDNAIEVDVELERVPAKRQRTSSPSMTTDGDCIRINYHMGIELKFQKDIVACTSCEENLDPGYSHLDCNHNLCRRCSEKLMTPARKIKCPICRNVSDGMKEVPMLTTILNMAPRKLKCGKSVAGWKGEKLHSDCLKCMKIELGELKAENESVKKSNSNLLKKYSEQGETLNHLREEHEKLQEKYEDLREDIPLGRLRDDSDDESTSDV
jgi:FtsZ-binding cell division protein ZapB